MTYEYECRECHHRWEEEQRITEAPVKICPECHKEAALRLISQSAFILNGPGWFRSGGY